MAAGKAGKAGKAAAVVLDPSDDASHAGRAATAIISSSVTATAVTVNDLTTEPARVVSGGKSGDGSFVSPAQRRRGTWRLADMLLHKTEAARMRAAVTTVSGQLLLRD